MATESKKLREMAKRLLKDAESSERLNGDFLPRFLFSFSVCELVWKSGLSFVPWAACFFYVMISAIVFLAVCIDMLGVNAVKVHWSRVLASIILVSIFAYII